MQRHQLDHTQTTCTSLQTDNHISTSSLNLYRTDAHPDEHRCWMPHSLVQLASTKFEEISRDFQNFQELQTACPGGAVGMWVVRRHRLSMVLKNHPLNRRSCVAATSDSSCRRAFSSRRLRTSLSNISRSRFSCRTHTTAQ